MTHTPGPRAFDPSRTGIADRSVPPALDRVFWHCTRARHLQEILRTGLIPERSRDGHTCLATHPAAALWFGRVAQSTSSDDPVLDAPVLLRIPGAPLDPEAICPESGCVKGAPYGWDLPWRTDEARRALAEDAIALMGAVDALGYRQTLPIAADMVDARGEHGRARAARDAALSRYARGGGGPPSCSSVISS